MVDIHVSAHRPILIDKSIACITMRGQQVKQLIIANITRNIVAKTNRCVHRRNRRALWKSFFAICCFVCPKIGRQTEVCLRRLKVVHIKKISRPKKSSQQGSEWRANAHLTNCYRGYNWWWWQSVVDSDLGVDLSDKHCKHDWNHSGRRQSLRPALALSVAIAGLW